MMSVRDGRLARLALPQGAVWLLTDIAEAKGRQELYSKQAPQLLRALREMALEKAGKVVCLGRGPGAVWRKAGNTPMRG